MALSALVIPAVFMAVTTGFRQEQNIDLALLSESRMQRVADVLQEDIRNSWPSDKRSGDPHQELSLEYLDERGELMRIFWYLDGSSLVRIEMFARSGDTISKEEILTGVKVEEVFRYWTDQGKQIKEQLAACAVRVTVSLRSVDDNSDVDTSFDVAHRVRNPEAQPCV